MAFCLASSLERENTSDCCKGVRVEKEGVDGGGVEWPDLTWGSEGG